MAMSADRTVDQLSDKVCVACMALKISDHVDERPMEGNLSAFVRPPRHLSYGVERKRIDGGVGVRPCPVTEVDHTLGCLVSPDPHVTVRLAVVHPGQRLGKGPPEDRSEVPGFDTCDVPEQPKQVRTARHQRPAHVVLRQPIELPEHDIATRSQVALQLGLGIERHQPQSGLRRPLAAP